MALVISVAQLKGGAAKTTTAIALAEAAADAMPDELVTVVDTDPMGGASRYSTLADQDGRPLSASVVGYPKSDVDKRLSSITHGARLVVIDGPPPGELRVAEAAIRAATIVVMPTPARLGDLDRVPATVAIARTAGCRVYGVLTFVQVGAPDNDVARSTLAAHGVTVLDTVLPLRRSVSRNYGRRPAGVMAVYGRELLDEITQREKNG